MTEKNKYRLVGVAKLSSGRQVTIPKEVVEERGWEEKETKLKIISDDEGVILTEAGEVSIGE